MTLSDRDLSQLDTDYLDDLPEGQLRSLSKQLLVDLKAAHERLKQSPETSSRPPSSREPWKASAPHTPDVVDNPSAADEHAPDPTTPGQDSTQAVTVDASVPESKSTADTAQPEKTGGNLAVRVTVARSHWR